MPNYDILRSISLQGGINSAASPLSPTSQESLSAESYNAVVNGDGAVSPWAGATSQGANSGSRKLLAFGNTWGGIADFSYLDKTFTAPGDVGTNQVTVSSTSDYITGLSCTVSTGGTLPTGLVALTTYYLIVVDATHLAFATSLVNALLGTATPITTGTGSGTITIDVTNSSVTASGNWMQDIGLSRWGIGSGQPKIEGVSVPGFQLSTNLQVQIPVGGVFGPPVQAGLSQPSAPDIGIIQVTGLITNSISAKIERSRPSTGARSLASETSAVVVPQANRIYVRFPLASSGQTHWRVYFPFAGFGGVGVHYLGTYNGLQDIPEATVAAGNAGGGGATATGTLQVDVNPSPAETISINGVTFTFIAGVSTATDVQIGATEADTAANLASVLSTSGNPAITVASYVAAGDFVTITYGLAGTAGNAYTLADSSGGNVLRSAATLTGGVDGIGRSLEFNFQDGDLIPIEASFDDYPPPAATHAIRLNTVMNLVGAFADSSSDPTASNTGTCIAVSKENNYESYVPTSLLYLPEQVVDVLARPMDDYGYIGCQNSIHAIQYVGNRGDDLPSCTITTVLPDIGIQYLYNWCFFRGQLLVYTAQGNLILMDGEGQFDTDFANDVSKILKSFTTVATSVGYDPMSDSIVVMNGKRMLVYSLQRRIWRQIWLPDFALAGATVSCVAAKRALYFTMLSGSISTAYTYGTNTLVAPMSFVSNYLNTNGAIVNDVYEMAVAAQTSMVTKLALVVNRNLSKTSFRQIQVTNSNVQVVDSEGTFSSNMVGKRFILFGTAVGGGGTLLLQGTVATFIDKNNITLSVAPSATLADCLMFVGNYAAVVDISQTTQLQNFFPNLAELRSYSVATWIQGHEGIGNVLDVTTIGASYASSRAAA